jgi:hypothetical protein
VGNHIRDLLKDHSWYDLRGEGADLASLTTRDSVFAELTLRPEDKGSHIILMDSQTSAGVGVANGIEFVPSGLSITEMSNLNKRDIDADRPQARELYFVIFHNDKGTPSKICEIPNLRCRTPSSTISPRKRVLALHLTDPEGVYPMTLDENGYCTPQTDTKFDRITPVLRGRTSGTPPLHI